MAWRGCIGKGLLQARLAASFWEKRTTELHPQQQLLPKAFLPLPKQHCLDTHKAATNSIIVLPLLGWFLASCLLCWGWERSLCTKQELHCGSVCVKEAVCAPDFLREEFVESNWVSLLCQISWDVVWWCVLHFSICYWSWGLAC